MFLKHPQVSIAEIRAHDRNLYMKRSLHVQGQTLPLKMPSLEWQFVGDLRGTTYADAVASVWRPVGAPRYACIGDVLHKGSEPPSHPVTMFLKNPQVSEHTQAVFEFPVHYLLVWRDFAGKGLTIWRGQAPAGYQALGCLAAEGLDPPARTASVCVRNVRFCYCFQSLQKAHCVGGVSWGCSG
jgi:hypothetical protein